MRALPAKRRQVKETILALDGVEIPIEHDDGRMVVIIEENGERRSGEALMKIQTVDGVVSANLVYQHSEADSDDDDKEIVIPEKDCLND